MLSKKHIWIVLVISLLLFLSSCLIRRHIEGLETVTLTEQDKLTKRAEIELVFKKEGATNACRAIEDYLRSSTNVEMLRLMGDCYASNDYQSDGEFATILKVPEDFSYRRLPNRNLRNAVKFYQAAAACGDTVAKEALKKLNMPEALGSIDQGCDNIVVRVFSRKERDKRTFLALPVLIPLLIAASPVAVPASLISERANEELELPPFPEVGPSVTIKREQTGFRWMVGNRHIDKSEQRFETMPGHMEVRYYSNPSPIKTCGLIKFGNRCIENFELPECILYFDALPRHSYLLRSKTIGVWTSEFVPNQRKRALCTIQDELTGQIIAEQESIM